MKDQRMSTPAPSALRRALTLMEVAVSLGIVAIAVLSLLALLPSMLRQQEVNRYRIYAAAKAVDIMERFHKHSVDWGSMEVNRIPIGAGKTGDRTSTVEFHPDSTVGKMVTHEKFLASWIAAHILSMRLAPNQLPPDLETIVSNQGDGNLPVPPAIARRLRSANEEIRNIVDGGGNIYYCDPTSDGFSVRRTNLVAGNQGAKSDLRKLVWGVIGSPQQNAMPFHPMDRPVYELYPMAPTTYPKHSDNTGLWNAAYTGIFQKMLVADDSNIDPAQRTINIEMLEEYGSDKFKRTKVVRRFASRSEGILDNNWEFQAYREALDSYIAGKPRGAQTLSVDTAGEWRSRIPPTEDPDLIAGGEPAYRALMNQDLTIRGSSPWLLGLYEWRRMISFHWARILSQSRLTNFGNSANPGSVIDKTGSKVIIVGNTRVWKKDNVPLTKAQNDVYANALNNAKESDDLVSSAPPIGMGIGGLRGSDLPYEDSEPWRGPTTVAAHPNYGELTMQGGDRDAQMRMNMPGLERRVMYRTAALMLWARVKPAFPTGPVAVNPFDFYSKDWKEKPMEFAPVDICSLPARAISGGPVTRGFANIESLSRQFSAADPMDRTWAVVPYDESRPYWPVTKTLPPDPNVADLVANLRDEHNPLLSILPVPPGEKIHPAQIYALNVLAHAAQLVTGYKPPFIDAKGTAAAGDDAPQVQVRQLTMPYRPMDKRSWNIVRWWNDQYLPTGAATMPIVPSESEEEKAWLAWCSVMNGRDGAQDLRPEYGPYHWHGVDPSPIVPENPSAEYNSRPYDGTELNPRTASDAARRLWKSCWLSFRFNPFHEQGVGKNGDYDKNGVGGIFMQPGKQPVWGSVNCWLSPNYPYYTWTSAGSTTAAAYAAGAATPCALTEWPHQPTYYAGDPLFDKSIDRSDYMWQYKYTPYQFAWVKDEKDQDAVSSYSGLVRRPLGYFRLDTSGGPLNEFPPPYADRGAFDHAGRRTDRYRIHWAYVEKKLLRCIIDSAVTEALPTGKGLKMEEFMDAMAKYAPRHLPAEAGRNDASAQAAGFASLMEYRGLSDTSMARIALENCLRWTYAYTAVHVQDSLVPKPANIQLSIHEPLCVPDLFTTLLGQTRPLLAPNRPDGINYSISGVTATDTVWDAYRVIQGRSIPVQGGSGRRAGPMDIPVNDMTSFSSLSRNVDIDGSGMLGDYVGLPSNPAVSVLPGFAGMHRPWGTAPPMQMLGTAGAVTGMSPTGSLMASITATDIERRSPILELRPRDDMLWGKLATTNVLDGSSTKNWGDPTLLANRANAYAVGEVRQQARRLLTSSTPWSSSVLGANFDATDRGRTLVFWMVDWLSYADAETAASAPVDAFRLQFSPISIRNHLLGRFKPYDMTKDMDSRIVYFHGPNHNKTGLRMSGLPYWQGKFIGTDSKAMNVSALIWHQSRSLSIFNRQGNPEGEMAWLNPRRNATPRKAPPDLQRAVSKYNAVTIPPTSPGGTSGTVWVDAEYMGTVYMPASLIELAGALELTGMQPWEHLGVFGADRNGNGVLDVGPIPPAERLTAIEVGRYNFYDPIAWSVGGR